MSARILPISTVVFFLSIRNGETFLPSSLLSIPKLNKLESLSTMLDPEPLIEVNFEEIAARHGHRPEEYRVYTEDGYMLKIFRLPGKGYGLPVLLFHGFGDSADTWVIRGNHSLGITLANAGYDVWFGNVRGNKYSQGHVSLSLATNSAFWNFSLHEVGVRDLPTTIDFILNKTGAPNLNYIGHSQGTTINFVLLSTKPEYNDKVNLFIALAPVVYLHSSPPPLGLLLRSMPVLYDALSAVQKYELYGDMSPERAFIRTACPTPATAYAVCLLGMAYQFAGYDLTEIEPDFSLVVFKHFPTTVSTKIALHYGQVTIRETFAHFDYGPEGNLVAYDSPTPPEYELRNVRTKVVLLTATNDFLSTQPDVDLLRRQLPNVVKFVINPRPQMNHVDYVWGRNMRIYIFPYIFDSLQQYG